MSRLELMGKAVRKFASKVYNADMTPKALLITGVVTIGAGVAATVVQSVKASDDIYEFKDTVETIKECKENGVFIVEDEETGEEIAEKYTDDMYRKDMAWAFLDICKVMAKRLGLPLTVVVVGIIEVCKAHGMVDDRLTASVLSYMALDKQFKQYRKNVVEQDGEEADSRYLYGIRKQKEAIVETYDEYKDEMTAKKQKNVDILEEGNMATDFAFLMEQCSMCDRDPKLDEITVNSIVNRANIIYDRDGVLPFMWIVDAIGYTPKTDEELGRFMTAGWLKGYSDDHVKIQTRPCLTQGSEDGLFAGRTLLTFNASPNISTRLIKLSKVKSGRM